MANRSLINQVFVLARTQEFYWFLGHLLSIIFFILQFVETFSGGIRFYRLGLISIIFTYIIVIKQIHFKSRSTIKNLGVKTLLKDENFQYFFLSIWFYVVSFVIGKVNGSIYSFNIYSVFHILTYFQNNLLHYLPLNINTEASINQMINKFQVSSNQMVLSIAANSEIFIVFNLVVSLPMLILRFKLTKVIVQVLTIAVVVIFIKLRFMNNSFTNNILKQYDYKVSTYLTNPQLAQFSHYYQAAKINLISLLKPFDVVNEKKKQ